LTKQADLIAYIFEGQTTLLSSALMQWLEASSRFTEFVETHHNKIRKKVRVTRLPQSILDLRIELEVAYRLLNDRRLLVAYEPYVSEKRRGPDFAVTYRDNLIFNVEVSRMHIEGNEENHFTSPRNEERILRTLLEKLGQMQPGMPNLLVIYTQPDLAQSVDLPRLIQEMKSRVEGKALADYAAGRYPAPTAFYRDFLHLSGILLWADSTQQWVNRQARPHLAEKIIRLVGSLVIA
jgi:hypothetical protein